MEATILIFWRTKTWLGLTRSRGAWSQYEGAPPPPSTPNALLCVWCWNTFFSIWSLLTEWVSSWFYCRWNTCVLIQVDTVGSLFTQHHKTKQKKSLKNEWSLVWGLLPWKPEQVSGKVVSKERWSLIWVVYYQGGLSSRWSLIRVVFYLGWSHQGSLSSGQSLIRMVLIRVVFHQGNLLSGWSLSGWSFIRAISYKDGRYQGWSHQGDLSSEWSFIRVVSHQGVLSSGWSLTWVVSHQGGLLSRAPLKN